MTTETCYLEYGTARRTVTSDICYIQYRKKGNDNGHMLFEVRYRKKDCDDGHLGHALPSDVLVPYIFHEIKGTVPRDGSVRN